MSEAEEAYIKQLENYKKLFFHEELLISLSKMGYQNAKNKLMLAKQEVVLDIALNFLGEGLPFLEIINEGNVGLIEGIDKINSFNGENFDDYLSPFIQSSIQEALANLPKQRF